MKSFIYILFLIHFVSLLGAQTRHTISGSVTDIENGETLGGATITIEELPGTGISSNAYGYYVLTLPEGVFTLKINYIGYKTLTYQVNNNNNIRHDFKMEVQVTDLREVNVFPFKRNENIVQNNIGIEKILISEIKDIPVFFGEQDIMKTVSLTPGVTSVRDGNGGLNVRGGNNSHNLVLVDEATIYHPNHLLGFFSTFNSDAIKEMTLYKATAPASYGGRISSVMDIRMKDGNNQSLEVSGGLGLISSRLAIEGPIVKDRGSFFLAGRRTYVDMLLKLTSDPDLKNNTLNFYDLNAKINYKINEKNRIFLSAYTGRDAFGIPDHFGLGWGNRAATFRWNHIWYDKLFSNTSIIYSEFDYKVDLAFEPSVISLLSGIKNYNFKHEFHYFLNENSRFTLGYDYILYNITPGQLLADENATFHPMKIQERNGRENAIYFSNEFKPSPKWIINFGIRLNTFRSFGPGIFYQYKDGVLTDSTTYKRNEVVKSYFTPERRLSITHIINPRQSLKMAYSTNSQHIHMVTTTEDVSLPVDIWIMSSKNVKPQNSDQISAGYFHNIKNDMYQFSAETYFKWMHDQTDFRNSPDVMANQHIEGELVTGNGRSYGLELMLKKKYGKLNGWIGYTLSRTELSIPGINDGNWYPARQDITNDVSVVGIYELTKYLTMSATWVYQTGNAVTFPSGKYKINDEVKYYYNIRNGNRMPDYHRLDLGVTWNFKSKRKYKSSLNFSVYNAYARKNAFSINFEEDPSDPEKTYAVMTYLFTAIPSITYNFNF
ncbi:MAG: TonB-dependent receptor [Paludibacter sp.]|nr:TonB-dependent receptor [Paludibacter sp.]